MYREILRSFVEKYHLDGLSESVKWVVTKKEIIVNAGTTTTDCASNIVLKNDEYLPPCEFGVFNTSQLDSMISILNDNITVEIEGVSKLNLTDNNYSISYQLADLSLIKKSPKVKAPPFDGVIELTPEFVTSFNQAKGALDKLITRVSLKSENDQIKITFGEKAALAHKITFSYPCKTTKPIVELPFSSDTLKTIFQCNKNFESGTIEISNEGLCRIYIDHGEIKSEYFVIRTMDV